MPSYGTFLYGERKYGEFVGAVTHSSIYAQTVSYEKVNITLGVAASSGLGYILVRTTNGSAEDPSDGLSVATGTVNSPVITVSDVPVGDEKYLPHGFIYYTLFLFNSSGQWSREAATSVLVPRYRNTLNFFRSGLPGFYNSEQHNPIDPATDTTDLLKFLSGFATTYDELSEYIDTILPENRTQTAVRRLHEAYARGVGMPSEYTIGTIASARLFRESGYIYRNKGTITGITTYVEALTAWGANVKPSTNLFLTLDDGSFETSVGNWSITGGTLAVQTASGPSFAYEGALSQFSRLGVGKVTLSSATATMSLPSSLDTLKMIPVTADTTYHWSIPAKAVSGTPTVRGTINWITEGGTLISSSVLTTATSTTSWVTTDSSATAPATAAYAQLVIRVQGSSSDSVYLDMMNFTTNTSFYRDPKAVTVILSPERSNYIADPSMQSTSTTWAASSGTFTHSTDQALIGTKSGKMSGSPFSVESNTIPALGDYAYSVAAYAYSSGGTCEVRVTWYDSGSSVIRTDVKAFDSLSTSWVRVDDTVISPANAASVVVSFAGTGTVYVDAVTFELTDRPQVFFSGSVADSLGQDGLWSGTAENSYSWLYNHRYTKLARLKQTLPYYLPAGVVSRILFWDSQDPEVTALLPYGG